MSAITIDHATKVFSGTSRAVDDVSMDVHEGKFVVLLGPSGCGKTTLLRMVNRLIEPTSGRICIDGVEIHDIGKTELRRHIGYVIQQVGLFPHMNVAQNVAVVPRLLGWPRNRIRARTEELLNLVGLPPDQYLKRYPRELSGGQQQRIGIARAMAADPPLMLMDEPFGAIDAITRTDLQDELLKIQRKVAKTVMFVTHDVEEALRLADTIAVMQTGRVVQFDSPLNLLTHPKDEFVSALLGADDVFRQLSLVPVSEVAEPLNGAPAPDGLLVEASADVRSALSELLSHGSSEAAVMGKDGKPTSKITLRAMLQEASNLRNGKSS